jgi:hypothetical protein
VNSGSKTPRNRIPATSSLGMVEAPPLVGVLIDTGRPGGGGVISWLNTESNDLVLGTECLDLGDTRRL